MCPASYRNRAHTYRYATGIGTAVTFLGLSVVKVHCKHTWTSLEQFASVDVPSISIHSVVKPWTGIKLHDTCCTFQMEPRSRCVPSASNNHSTPLPTQNLWLRGGRSSCLLRFALKQMPANSWVGDSTRRCHHCLTTSNILQRLWRYCVHIQLSTHDPPVFQNRSVWWDSCIGCVPLDGS